MTRDDLIEELQTAANFCRGMALDPSLLPHQKAACVSKANSLDLIVSNALDDSELQPVAWVVFWGIGKMRMLSTAFTTKELAEKAAAEIKSNTQVRPLYDKRPEQQSSPARDVQKYAALAHRTASKYAHSADPNSVAYTFLPHTLKMFSEGIHNAAMEEAAILCEEMHQHYMGLKDTALLNGSIDLSNAMSGEPRACEFLAAQIRERKLT